MVSVVICDDDHVTRGAVTVVCEDLGLEVIAETDRWTTSLELIQRFEVDLLVLDLSLMDGSGEHALESLKGVPDAPKVVVFSAYVRDFSRLTQFGATEVVEKPDFDRLGIVLGELAGGVATVASDQQVSRRVDTRDPSPLPVIWRSPSGIASNRDLHESLLHVIQGDCVVAAALGQVDSWAVSIGTTLVTDCRLAVGRLLASTVRAQDVVHEDPHTHGFIGLLRGGTDQAGSAVLRRLERIVEAANIPGRLIVAGAVVDSRGALDAVRLVTSEILSGHEH